MNSIIRYQKSILAVLAGLLFCPMPGAGTFVLLLSERASSTGAAQRWTARVAFLLTLGVYTLWPLGQGKSIALYALFCLLLGMTVGLWHVFFLKNKKSHYAWSYLSRVLLLFLICFSIVDGLSRLSGSGLQRELYERSLAQQETIESSQKNLRNNLENWFNVEVSEEEMQELEESNKQFIYFSIFLGEMLNFVFFWLISTGLFKLINRRKKNIKTLAFTRDKIIFFRHPDWVLVILMLGWLVLLLGIPFELPSYLQVTAINTAGLSSLLVLLTGFGVVRYFFQYRLRTDWMRWFLLLGAIFLAIIAFPLGLFFIFSVVLALGLFDRWFDYRQYDP